MWPGGGGAVYYTIVSLVRKRVSSCCDPYMGTTLDYIEKPKPKNSLANCPDSLFVGAVTRSLQKLRKKLFATVSRQLRV